MTMWLTSALVELEGDVGVGAEAEVVVEDLERQRVGCHLVRGLRLALLVGDHLQVPPATATTHWLHTHHSQQHITVNSTSQSTVLHSQHRLS